MPDFHYTFTEFSPGNAGVITGASTTLQRDWRRPGREYLPPSDDGTHPRYDVYGLGYLFALYEFSENRRMGPKFSHLYAERASRGIAIGALAEPGAIGDPHPLPVYDGAGRLLSEKDARTTAAIEIAQHIVRKTGGRKFASILPARYLIIWADGHATAESDVQAAFDLERRNGNADKLMASPLVVLDQLQMGSVLARRVGEPLVRVTRK